MVAVMRRVPWCVTNAVCVLATLLSAGGTGFCDLAKKNLGPGQTPPYYCMVDNKGSLATPPWNQEQKVLGALARGGGGGFRVTSNEWDLYERRMGAWAGAVLATTFRHPVDRSALHLCSAVQCIAVQHNGSSAELCLLCMGALYRKEKRVC